MSQVGEGRSARVARYSALQSSAEIGIGTAMHALHIPLGGHAMSLNQGLLLTFAAREVRGNRLDAIGTVLGISGVAAALKPLSPAGNRLGPMLAIAVQGVLYAAGVAVFGANILGVSMGIVLLSVWGFLQPLILGSLIFGTQLWDALVGLWTELAQTLGWDVEWGWTVLIAVVGIKAVLAIAVGCVGWWSSVSFAAIYRQKLGRLKFSRVVRSAGPQENLALAAIKDLANPWYLASLGVTLGFLVGWRHTSLVEAAWFVLRALIAGWAVFWCVRWIPRALQAPRVRAWLKRFPGLVRAFEEAARETR